MEKLFSSDNRLTNNDRNAGQINGQTSEFDSFVEDFEREADEVMPDEDQIVSLARRDMSLDAQNLRELVAQHAHLLPKEVADEFSALILNAPYGSAKYRIGLLKPLSADDKRRFSRILKVYSTSETVIKFQMLDSMLFQILKSEAYEQKNLIRKQKRREQEKTRETRVWGSDGSNEGNETATQQAKSDAQTVEELSGKRVDISDLSSYHDIQNQIDKGLITEYSLETFAFCKFMMQDFTLSGASDMHLDAFRDGGRVRYRLQGEMFVRFDKIPPTAFQQICYCLCIWGGKDPAKMKRAGVATVLQMLANIDNEIKPVEYRFQSNPTLYNPSITLRGQAKPLRDINKVGFTPIQLGDVMAALSNDRGIIVVTGPTGSGKTNTLNCILAILEEDDNLAITELGAPVEIESQFRRQTTMPDTASETQNEIIRQQYFMDAMRSDPDVICYTEIRSADESKTAFRAAVTGHLVLTTLHAADVEETFGRLFEMNIDRSIIAKGILAIVAQTLIRKLCEHCRIEDEEATQMAGSGITIYRANDLGCAECDDGYKGRTVVAEVLRFNDDVQRWINENRKPGDIARLAVEANLMEPMKLVARNKLNAGITSELEVKNLVELRPTINVDAISVTDAIIFDEDTNELPIQEADYIDVAVDDV